MADFSMKANDRLPVIKAVLKRNGAPLDLTNATSVDFIMKGTGPTGAVKVNSPAEIVDAPGGVVQYAWAIGDTNTPGTYQGEWEITWQDGKPQTVPTKSYHAIEVAADLDSEA